MPIFRHYADMSALAGGTFYTKFFHFRLECCTFEAKCFSGASRAIEAPTAFLQRCQNVLAFNCIEVIAVSLIPIGYCWYTHIQHLHL
jgi:hypothetical protein